MGEPPGGARPSLARKEGSDPPSFWIDKIYLVRDFSHFEREGASLRVFYFPISITEVRYAIFQHFHYCSKG